MGEFKSGYWILGVFIYYFFIFSIIGFIAGSMTAVGDSFEGSVNEGDYWNTTATDNTSDTIASADSIGTSNFRSLVSIVIGYGIDDVSTQVPSDYLYLVSFMFFWIPAFIGVWALYMAMPFLH